MKRKCNKTEIEWKNQIIVRIACFLLILGLIGTLVNGTAFLSLAGNVQGQVTLQNPKIVKNENMEAGQKVTWDCIWFGSYPQAEVVSSGEYEAVKKEYLEDGDVIVDDNLYAVLQSASGWDEKRDIIYNGEKYRRMKKENAISDHDGMTNWSGNYYWKNNTTYHYFKYEPVKWRVLNISDGKALLLSDKVIDDCWFYDYEIENYSWEKSTIRSFLNGYDIPEERKKTNSSNRESFINSAFDSDSYLSIIDTTNVPSNLLDEDSFDNRNSTIDKIFLLSDAEVYGTEQAAMYGFNIKDENDEAKQCKSTTYAKAMGMWWDVSTLYKGNCWWWLRYPPHLSDYTMDICESGALNDLHVL